ncbi:putative bifunctional diguanylate cyclase/phosphodiesterase [Rhizobium sp. SL86]|uniref:putative bifunctional diguanylate cyclase/phosphodiesterase n=1 Tax=Rhizobium sp. SL86 TaxID=2995148 RepID=UPI0022762311|nr:bifunctional diguanylate cyclase/phosphodiesterase [Rhizobium sp. SL86]MCY1667074.1 bifunctional diguanylate cyclase/phosphodiesterase [Rhizobium sp. SL86]
MDASISSTDERGRPPDASSAQPQPQALPPRQVYDARLQTALLRIAYKNTTASVFVHLFASLGAAYLAWPIVEVQALLILWLSAQLVLCAARLAQVARSRPIFRASAVLPLHVIRRLRIYNGAGQLIVCLVWASFTFWAVIHGTDTIRHTGLIIISALAAGATGTLAAEILVGRLYISGMLLQGSVALMLTTRPDPVIALLGVVFTLAMLVVHRNNHQVLAKSLMLRFANQDLVLNLQAEQQALAELNATLEARVSQRTTELKTLAEHDALTDVLNRTGLLRWCEQRKDQLGHDDAFAAIFIDLDRFKQINDGLGHTFGDRVLAETAGRLSDGVAPDAALCRWGGDEFVIVLSGPQDSLHDKTIALAEHIRSLVEQPMEIAGHDLSISFSAGIAFAIRTDDDISEAIHCADLAAGAAKRKGRGVTESYNCALLTEQERNLTIAQSFKSALERREFTVAFQPIVKAGSHRVECYEALCRWVSPKLGRVSPDEFIAVAEETGDIVKLGAFVLNEALARLASEDLLRHGVKVAVNVSVRQLVAPGFVEQVRSALSAQRVPPRSLVLEVTESVFDPRNRTVILTVLTALKGLGIEIHVDDFGTGYSSLSRLHEMPISALKIDKSFVQALDTHGRAIISGTTVIARDLGIEIIAEGVETERQAAQLEELGINSLQGYLFGKPSADIGQPLDDAPQAKAG